MSSSNEFRSAARLRIGLAIFLPLWNFVLLTSADDATPRPASATQSGSGLEVGVEVVLKVSDTPLFDQGRMIPSQDNLTFLIERIEEDRILVVSRDKSIRGWLIREQIVPLGQAIASLTEALVNDPRNTDLLWQRGRTYFYVGEDDRALANLNMAIRLEPDQSRFYITRGMIQLRKQEPDKAIEDCDKAIELGSNTSWVHVIRASAWIAKNDPQRARGDLDAALRLDATNPSGRSEQATKIAGDKDPGKGLTVASTDVRPDSNAQDTPGLVKPPADDADPSLRDPKNLGDLMASGNASQARKDYDKALAAYSEALRLDPNYAPAYAARAQTWARKHYRDRELADISAAIKLDPNNAAYRVARGESWSAQGRHERAMADFDEAIQMDPNDPAKYVSRGNERRKHLQLDDAIADYTHAVEINPRYAAGYIARGQTWKQRHVYDQAIREFSNLIQVDPENSEGHWSLARLLATCYSQEVRDGRRAVAFATRACELTRWQNPDCLDTLAAACAESGDFQSAVKWQTQAIRLVRQNVPSALLRAQDVGGRRGVGFDDRLAFYKSKKPTRE
jgi:tetratricopeptide (TPR) repeat protein